MRAQHFLAAAVLVALAAGAGSATAHETYRLHVHTRGGSGRGLDFEMPWSAKKGGTPFDFTNGTIDDVSLERLRGAWVVLQTMPEGRAVTIRSKSETIKAWRRGGYLVLEPHDRDGEDHHARIRIPDYIVNTIIEHDGRLTGGDVAQLVRERGTVTLVAVNSDEARVKVWIDRGDHEVD